MQESNDKPLIVQSDLMVLLDERKPDAQKAREKLVLFMDAVRRSGDIHTYQMTPLTLWNAASAGMEAEGIVSFLTTYSRFGLPYQAESLIRRLMGRYGKLWLSNDSGKLVLQGDMAIMNELYQHASIVPLIKEPLSDGRWLLVEYCRGTLKQELTRLGYPVIDLAGYHAGEELVVQLRERTLGDRRFDIRDYQQAAVEQFYKEGTVQGGSGVIVLPCGAGKTIVGIAALARLGRATLILTSNSTSVKQWKDELLDKTSLQDAEVGQYGGMLKQVRPVTIATYQILTHRKSKEMPFTHMKLFTERDWGLIIYDEVHLLPAPVFRMTADIQATRRLGLTATLVREDGCAEDVYSLIGPKQYDMQWKTAEAASHIAAVACTEIRVPLHRRSTAAYAQASARSKLRLAAENPAKFSIVEQLLREHAGKPTLIIGQYLNQLHALSAKLGVPLLTGEVPQQERQLLYDRFRAGELPVLIVSKIANFAVDLPDASVAIQLSGSFGSRQEEAQRIGRLLRPKAGMNKAWFFTLVTDETKEMEFAMKRQLFMLEQGYPYERLLYPEMIDTHEEAAAQ
ncbi:DNA excision repair protein ERCC-3 [Paenibacillus endophyticus]|uniref:DNA 3'-5' helicase n=1 Tax=Paenibacillus endophyticus TaxID=1294268 RepID=A0A7W5C703_9BACL|nr:DNA repair helicase XPB [Paenibacillus endophyticus]MBB3152241.1 DNA excision repair protein ERCC-3 [Paenibacillus endophyticus]